MSIFETTLNALNTGRKTLINFSSYYSTLTAEQKEKQADISGQVYKAFFKATAEDLTRLGSILAKQEDGNIGQVLYQLLLPNHAKAMAGIDKFVEELEAEPVMTDEEEPNEVPASEAVSVADIAAGTVKRGQAHLKPLPFEFRRSYMK
tara:strand:- start:355 stop:798 length:444 start_codon:yes stop_codon:yes gene_type:complete